MAEFRCDGCGKRTRGRPHTSVTGRHLCADCSADLTALAAGMIAGGAAEKGATPEVAARAIATQGWFRRLLRRRDDTAHRSSSD